MQIAKRIFLFVATNILIVATLSLVLSAFGVQPYLNAKGIDFSSLMVFCLVWGFGGALISLAVSRIVAKWTMGVKLIGPDEADPRRRLLAARVRELASRAGLKGTPEVGVYESPEANAFATGPTQRRSLVAVSSGLLERMDERETTGVLAHEVAHIANGDMVTMTLVQGVVNAFVMFLARVVAFAVGGFAKDDARPLVRMASTFVLEILFGILGMLVVARFSRAREYRADGGGAALAGTGAMVAALEALKRQSGVGDEEAADQRSPSLAAFKISGKSSGMMKLFSTHPDLDDRIQRLKSGEGARHATFLRA